VSGSAPLPAGLHREIATECGQQVLERYGTTETLMNTSNPYDGERRPGTVGMPLPGVELRLERGSGEIQVRGPNVFGGYWRRRDLMHDTFDDGWFRTGDIGEYDDDGYIRIRGRSKELIITGGLNVYPKEVEEVLLGHPGVSEVAVVGTPSDEWGELVTAFVVSADRPLDQSVLDGVARANLAAHKVPRAYRFVDALPRNALGKVLRSKLTEP
jgi:malonyl-CoA/methylmalonyl-CoA synthetase